MRYSFTVLARSLLAALLLLPALASASSHREAPAISEDPAADNTDLYAWMSPKRDKLYVIANYNPLQEPSGGPNFHRMSDQVLYTVHIARGPSSLADVMRFHFIFTNTPVKKVSAADKMAPLGGGKEFFRQLAGGEQTYEVVMWTARGGYVELGGGKVAPPNIGPRTNKVAYKISAYDDAYAATFIHTLPGGVRTFVGPRDDGFYVDLGGIFDLANLRKKGTARDGVAGYNVHSIALEIPATMLTTTGKLPPAGVSTTNTLGIWASASRPQFAMYNRDGRKLAGGDLVQVSRLGLPLVNEALIGLQDKDRFNAGHPMNDARDFAAYFLNPVIVRDAEAVGIYRALGKDPTPFKWNRTDILNIISLKTAARPIATVGDVLRVDMGVASKFPNGRAIPGGARADQEQVDVTDTLLSVLLSKGLLKISDGVDYNDKPFLKRFPWLPLPHEGYGAGHGKTTP